MPLFGKEKKEKALGVPSIQILKCFVICLFRKRNIFNPTEVYVYAMGQEPWCEFISSIKYTDQSNPIVQSNLLIAACAEKGIVAERLFGEKEILYTKRM